MSPFTLFIFQWVMPVYSAVALIVCAFAVRAIIRDQRRIAAAGSGSAREAAEEPPERPAEPVGARRGSR